MRITILEPEFSICKLKSLSSELLSMPFFFLCRTADEISFVCPTNSVPQSADPQNNEWKCFYLNGELNFSLIGVIAKITKILAEHEISVFVTSTYNTDYLLVKKEKLSKAVKVLSNKGFEFQ